MPHYRPNDRYILEQAAELRMALDRGGIREREAFAEWLLESRRHVRNYLLLVAFEHELKKLDPERRHDVDRLLADAALDIVPLPADRSPLRGREPSASIAHWQHRMWAGLAAASVAAAVFLSQRLDVFEPASLYKTGTGEQQTLKLEDGSVVYLNAQSRLQVSFSERQRKLELLDGEALFVVEQDPRRPFRVFAGTAVVQALGTQFNVRRGSDGTLVSVIQGRVRLEPGAEQPRSPGSFSGEDKVLAAGEEARVNGEGHIQKEASANVDRRVTWRQRLLEFREDSLATVVAEFNRYNRTPQFRVADPELGERAYTGVFKADDPESLAQLLAQESDLVVERGAAEIVIRRR